MNEWKKIAGLAVLLAATLPVSACAKQAPDSETQTGSPESRQSVPSVSARPAPAGSDANAGKGMTLRQFEQRREQRIMAADTNHDGKVSRAEFMAAMISGKGDPAKRFGRLDRNGDGFVDRQEIDAAAARRFGKLDIDGNGRVDKSERRGGSEQGSVRAGRAVGDDAE